MESRPPNVFTRAARMLLLCLALSASLLAFPSGLPFMIAFWLGVYTIPAALGKKAWPAILLPAIVVVGKNAYLAGRVLEALRRLYGDAILRPTPAP